MNPESHGKKSDLLWDILSILALVGILIVVAVVAVIFINPQSALNPLRPPELAELVPALTMTPEMAPLSAAPTIIAEANQPFTITVTPGVLVVSPTTQPTLPPQPTTAPAGPAQYEFVVIDDPLAMPASEYDPAHGCEWMGIAGQLFDIMGSPVMGLRVQVRGTLDGNTVEMIGMSGTAPIYGESGYEVRLADHPIASSGQVSLQLIDQAGLPLSEVYPFDTYETCEENLILIDFQEIR